MKVSFGSLLGEINLNTIVDAIMGFFAPIFYGIQIGLFYIINTIESVVKKLVGIEPHWWRNRTTDETVGPYNTDPAMTFLQTEAVQETFLSVLIAAVFLLIIATFVGVIKTEFNEKGENSKTPVIESAIKGLAYFFIVPITCYIGIFVANVVLKMLDSATSRGAQHFSNQIFAAASARCNKIREKHDARATIIAWIGYMSIHDSGALHSFINGSFDKALRTYYFRKIVDDGLYKEYIINTNKTVTGNTTTGKKYPYSNKLFVHKDLFTETATGAFNVGNDADVNSIEQLTFKAVLNPTELTYEDLYAVYPDIEKALPLGNNPENLVNNWLKCLSNVRLNVSTNQGLFMVTNRGSDYRTNADIIKWDADDNTGEDKLDESTIYNYLEFQCGTHLDGHSISADDCKKKFVDQSFIQWDLDEAKLNSYTSDFHESSIGIIYPTDGVSESGGSRPAYYDGWSYLGYLLGSWVSDTIDDWFRITWTEDYGDFAANIDPTEWDLSGLVVADYEVLANFVEDEFRAKNGAFDILNYFQVSAFYDLKHYNYLVGWLGAWLIVQMLLNLMIGCIQRIFEIAVLFVASPGFIALMPLDNGDRYKEWRKQFIQRVFMAYGPILGMNLSFMVLEMINDPNREFLLWDPKDAFADIGNGIMSIIIMFTALVCIKSITKMVTELIGQGDALKAGEETGKAAKDLALKTAGQLSNVATMPTKLATSAINVAKSHGLAQTKFNEHTFFDKDGNALSEDEYNEKVASGEINAADWQKGSDAWANADSATRKTMRAEAAKHGADTRRRRMLDYGYAAAGEHVSLLSGFRKAVYDDEKLGKDVAALGGNDTWLGSKFNEPLVNKARRKKIREAEDDERARMRVRGNTAAPGGGAGGGGGSVPAGGATGNGTATGGGSGSSSGASGTAGMSQLQKLNRGFTNASNNFERTGDIVQGKSALIRKLKAEKITAENLNGGTLTAADQKRFDAAEKKIKATTDATQLAQAIEQIKNGHSALNTQRDGGFKSFGSTVSGEIKATVKLDENSFTSGVMKKLKGFARSIEVEKDVIDRMKGKKKDEDVAKETGTKP